MERTHAKLFGTVRKLEIPFAWNQLESEFVAAPPWSLVYAFDLGLCGHLLIESREAERIEVPLDRAAQMRTGFVEILKVLSHREVEIQRSAKGQSVRVMNRVAALQDERSSR